MKGKPTVHVDPASVSGDDDPRHGVRVRTALAVVARPGVLIGVMMCALLAFASIFASIAYLAPSVDRLTRGQERSVIERESLALTFRETSELAIKERQELKDQITRFEAGAAEEQLVEDCVQLYKDDIDDGLALSVIAIADLFSSALIRPAAVTDEDRVIIAADNLVLDRALTSATDPLRAAVLASQTYRAIDPPPGVCPHPNFKP